MGYIIYAVWHAIWYAMREIWYGMVLDVVIKGGLRGFCCLGMEGRGTYCCIYSTRQLQLRISYFGC